MTERTNALDGDGWRCDDPDARFGPRQSEPDELVSTESFNGGGRSAAVRAGRRCPSVGARRRDR
jgi:hypothetical protein